MPLIYSASLIFSVNTYNVNDNPFVFYALCETPPHLDHAHGYIKEQPLHRSFSSN